MQFTTRSISAGGKLAWPISAKVKAVDYPGRSNKDGGLFNSNVYFSGLPLMCEVQTKYYDSEETQVILILGAQVHPHAGHHFISLGEVRSKRQLLN